MPDVSSKKFVQLFQSALAKGGRLSDADVSALKSAQNQINGEKERAAAESLMQLIRDDHELDSFEVAPTKRALSVLLGVSRGPLPADLERVLKNAVPQANVSVKNYDLSFDLSKDAPAFPARAVITLDKAAPKETILEANADRLTISKVLADGKEVRFEQKEGRLFVDAPGAKVLDVAYTVKPTEKSDDAYGLIKDKYTGRVWTMTWPYNTGALFPSNSLPKDGATSSVTVRVGPGMQALGTGNPVGDGKFVSSAEAPAYAVAFYGAKDFVLGDMGKTKDGVDVEGFGNGNRVSEANRKGYDAAAKEAVQWFSDWLGKYDYGNTLRLVELDGGLGGMEHVGAVAIMMSSARDADYGRETAVHETAHHWFGDNIRISNWGDFWMSEGFTNYATYRFFRAKEGDAKYFALLDRSKGELASALKANPHALSAPAYTDVNEIFDSVPYEMGPWLLRMMEVQLGTEKFDGLLRDWFQTMRQKSASTEDFIRFAKAKTGHDFGPFFKEWNAIRSVPSFDGSVKISGQSVSASLKPSGEYPKGLLIPLELLGSAGEKKTMLIDPTKPLTIDAGFKVAKTSWDPERTVLAQIR